VERPSVVERAYHTSGPFLPFAVPPGEDVPPFLPIGGAIPVRQTSSTHGPDGYITTDPAEIEAGVERLKRKVGAQIPSFTFFDLDPMPGARTLVVTYGVTARAARAAVAMLRQEHNLPVSLLVLKTLWPVPEQVLRDAAQEMERVLTVEMNLGQYVHEVRRVLCPQQVDFYGTMCGQLISPTEIAREVLRA
jgi:2-oxoglutarate ferredoxin oxidoreductase subunit alpha